MNYLNDNIYAAGRLHQSFQLHKGRMVMVDHITAGGAVFYKTLAGVEGTCQLSELDVSTPKGRWVNISSFLSVYLTRSPKRGGGYKQGLTPSNVRMVSPDGSRVPPQGRFMAAMANFNEEYPSFESALSYVKDKFGGTKAFRKDFCLWNSERGIRISYKGYGPVGEVLASGKVVLKDRWKHLEKRL